MKISEESNHFKRFVADLEYVVSKYAPMGEESLLEQQRRQIKKLVLLEAEFRDALIAHPWGPTVYKDFIVMVLETKRNLLTARPYFRERDKTFKAYISGALKNRNDKKLYRFRINWSFIKFVLNSRKWPVGGKIKAIANSISKMRNEILEMNLPLAISQARKFFEATPRSHLTFMDIVQIQCQGMLLAIDKFTPVNDSRMSNRLSLAMYRRFRATAIGIMTRDRINEYSATLIHFYPTDQKRMYRANKARRHVQTAEGMDYQKMADIVNVDLMPHERTNAEDIAKLLSAGSTVSSDHSATEEGEPLVETYVSEDEPTAEDKMALSEGIEKMRFYIKGLDVPEIKILKMKGVHV